MPAPQIDLEAATSLLTCGSERGSAFLVSERHALTSRHCVLDHLDDPTVPIELVSPSNPAAIRCTLVDVGIPLTEDTVLLKLESPLPNESVPPLVGSHIPAGLEWSSFGYPRVRGSLGARISGVTGRTISPDLATWDVELACDAASTLTSYKGASGSPVVVAGAVRAMLQERVDGALGAISLRRLQAFLRTAGIELQSTEASSRLPPRLKEQLAHLVPNTRTASDLELAISERENGYVLLTGTPGSGKSLFVAGFQPVEPSFEVVCRYFAGEPDLNNGPPALQRLSRTFADWLCQEAALISPDAVPVPRDATTAD